MPFSYHSFQEIWNRAGGRDYAQCYTCKIYHNNGFTLDCSHLDHSRDELYDTPERGVLECLNCHLCRHVRIYFFSLLKGKKKEIIDEDEPIEEAEYIDEAAGDLDPKELDAAEASIKNIQALADKISKTKLFEEDPEEEEESEEY